MYSYELEYINLPILYIKAIYLTTYLSISINDQSIYRFLHDIEIGNIQPVEGGDSIIDVGK